MCGIAGVAGPLAQTLGSQQVQGLLAALAHRGPDASAHWRAGDVILGHTRLSIRDLSPTGAQPMHSASGRSVIAYNGEVYGFDHLSARLRDLGVNFRGSSDTEVVLEHLERRGDAGLSDLNGMFGLAVWDREKRELLLARDPMGIKPLYFSEVGSSLAFASELKALLQMPGINRRIDRVALSHYLSLGFVPAPWTMLTGVRQLLPGHALRFAAGGGIRVCRFDSSPPGPAAKMLGSDLAANRAGLEEVLLACAGDQLVADVPVGVLLSGGVDSSLVAAAAARRAGRIRTFTVIHRDPRYDEREPARAVARHIGSEHVEVEIPADGLTRDELEALVDHHGDPFADSSSLPTRRLAREVRRHVTVALSGDGGDELFCGYPRYRQADLVHRLGALPRPLRRAGMHLATEVAGLLPDSSVRSNVRRISRALSLSTRPTAERAVGTITFFWPDEQQVLLNPDYRAASLDLARLIEEKSAPGMPPDEAEGCHFLEQQLVLPDDMLVKVDRMTMAESLEIRPVLLDQRIVSFARSLPMQHKLAGGEGKLILKDIARRWVPPWVVDRPKMGFAVPLLDFGGKVLADATRWALEDPQSPGRALFSATALQQLSQEFRRRGDGVAPEDSAFRRAHRQWVITLLCLAIDRLGVAL